MPERRHDPDTRSRRGSMAAQSTIGILGAGEIGRAVADKAVRHGHEVLIGNSRGPETLKAVVEQLGPKARAVTAEEAARPELVILAVPFSAVPDLTGLADWSGKIVVDTTNQFAAANPWRGRYDVGDLTGSEWVAERLPGARIVKAFNTLFAAFITADPQHEKGRQVVFYAGDDADAKAAVAGLLDEFGFAALDLGGLREGGRLMQLDGPLSAKHLLLMDVG
ncbi:NADPH-dependent F420 reductase [Streptomyces sp. NPDC059378]|uniref:NADPH-dependent F420 reductase n=1 Tax=Streptomyces sp. NPDC059378 TaxID=3346815 RepID=UPI0036C57F1E